MNTQATADVAPVARTDIAATYDQLAPQRETWIEKNAYFYEEDERYMRFLVPEGQRVLEIGCGIGQLLAALSPSYGLGIDISPEMVRLAGDRYPDLEFQVGDAEDPSTLANLNTTFDVVIVSDTIGVIRDCQRLLDNIASVCTPDTRVIIAYYSPYWEPLLRAAHAFGQTMPQPQQNWLTTSDIAALLELSNYQLIKREWRVLIPRRLLGVGRLINRLIAPFPLIRRFSLRNYLVARPHPKVPNETATSRPSTGSSSSCTTRATSTATTIWSTGTACRSRQSASRSSS